MLKIKNLSCQRGYNQLFSDLSFTVNSGDILRITGTNGSGKTSLLRILAGLSAQEKGEVAFNKYPVKSIKYQQQIFYLGHLSTLSSELSVSENLEFLTALNKPSDKQELLKSLENINLKGYEDEYCSKLSAGQKRRVILAGLFLSTANVWLLDEPFTALDPLGVKIVEELIIKHCSQGGSCIFTTHQDSKIPDQKILAL